MEDHFMFPLVSGLITGGAGLLGSMMSSDTSAQNTQAQIMASQQQQQTANAFTEQMSNTAYERASTDMKAAGLNPAAMFGSGSAASTPSASTVQAPMPQNTSPLGNLGATAKQALDSAVTAKTMDKMTDEIANLQANRGLITAETDATQERARKTGFEATREALAIPGSQFSAKSADDLLSMPEWLRKSANVGGFVGGKASDAIAPIVSSAGAVRRFLPTRSTTETTHDDGRSSFSERYNSMYGNSQ
jgi:DNA polymerase III gamma/tau subunit